MSGKIAYAKAGSILGKEVEAAFEFLYKPAYVRALQFLEAKMTSLLPNANWPTVNLPGQAKSLLKSTVSEVSSARIPKLELPKFSGDLKAWAHFLGSFEMRVYNRHHSKIDKFSYLISLLSCSALAAVQGLSVTADHYNTAIAIIKIERFVDLQVLISRHVEELCNLLPPSPPNECYS